MQATVKHPAPLDERCEECGKYLLRTLDRLDRELCAGHLERVAALGRRPAANRNRSEG